MTKIINSLYTVGDGDILEIQTTAYEKYSIIIKKQIFEVGQDENSGKFGIRIRNDEQGEVIITLNAGENVDLNTIENPEPSFKLTLISETAAPENYVFSVIFNNPSCPDNPLYNPMVAVLVNELIIQESNPSKIWADFNQYHTDWESILYFAQQGLICYDQVPNEPKIEDYH